MTQSDCAEGDTLLECDKNMITLEIYLAALHHGKYPPHHLKQHRRLILISSRPNNFLLDIQQNDHEMGRFISTEFLT